jgi:uncharacterized membrane protein YfcA
VDVLTIGLLAAAGFAAGAVNAAAGGGSLITFPALVAAGYAPFTANVTNSIAVLPGYVGGSLAYRGELKGQRRRIRALATTSALGAAGGAALLLITPASVFEAVVPWLILAACALLAVQPRAAEVAEHHRDRPAAGAVLHAVLLLAAIYGGYFGAGLGIMFIAILAVFLDDDIQRLNALKGLLSLVVAIIAAVGFVLFGPVAWSAALIIGATCLLGGWLGVGAVRRLPATALRWTIVVYGVLAAIVLMLDR